MTTYYPQLLASRILWDSDRSSASSVDDADVTAWVKANKIIVACQIGYNGKDTTASAYKLQWRNVTDSGSFADVSSTGEVIYSASSSTLVDGTAVTSTTRRCSANADQTWQDGLENVADNLAPNSGTIDLGSDYYTELQWSLDLSNSHSGDQYEFQLYNNTAGAAVGTCLAHVTIGNFRTLDIASQSVAVTPTAISLDRKYVIALDATSTAIDYKSITFGRGHIPGFRSLFALWAGGAGKVSPNKYINIDDQAFATVSTMPITMDYARAVLPESATTAISLTTIGLTRTAIISVESTPVTASVAAIGTELGRVSAVDPALVSVGTASIALDRTYAIEVDSLSLSVVGKAIALETDFEVSLLPIDISITPALVVTTKNSLINIDSASVNVTIEDASLVKESSVPIALTNVTVNTASITFPRTYVAGIDNVSVITTPSTVLVEYGRVIAVLPNTVNTSLTNIDGIFNRAIPIVLASISVNVTPFELLAARLVQLAQVVATTTPITMGKTSVIDVAPASITCTPQAISVLLGRAVGVDSQIATVSLDDVILTARRMVDILPSTTLVITSDIDYLFSVVFIIDGANTTIGTQEVEFLRSYFEPLVGMTTAITPVEVGILKGSATNLSTTSILSESQPVYALYGRAVDVNSVAVASISTEIISFNQNRVASINVLPISIGLPDIGIHKGYVGNVDSCTVYSDNGSIIFYRGYATVLQNTEILSITDDISVMRTTRIVIDGTTCGVVVQNIYFGSAYSVLLSGGSITTDFNSTTLIRDTRILTENADIMVVVSDIYVYGSRDFYYEIIRANSAVPLTGVPAVSDSIVNLLNIAGSPIGAIIIRNSKVIDNAPVIVYESNIHEEKNEESPL